MEVTSFDVYWWFLILFVAGWILLLSSKRVLSGSRPMWLVIGIWIVVLMAVPPVLEWMNANERYDDIVEPLLIGFSGVVAGQVCFVALLSGLRWGTWSVGYVIGIAILSAGLLALVLSFWLAGNQDHEAFVGLALFPSVLLSLSCPPIAYRYLLGWRLVGRGESTPQRDTFRLEDLFTLTTFAATNLVLLRIPQVIFEEKSEEYWIPMLIFCGVVFAIGLFVLPVCIRLALATKRRLASLGGLALLAMLVPGCIFGIAQLAAPRDTDWSQRLDALNPIMAVCGGATVALYASLFTLAWGGMSLIKTTRMGSAVGEQEKPQHASQRWLAASSIAVAIVVSLGMSRVERQRRDVDQENERLSKIAERLDGVIGIAGRKITEIHLGQRATDSDLDQFLECTDVTSIDLSDSAITDLGLTKLNHFPKTTSLMLNNTRVTDAGLAALNALYDLDWIELKDTKVDGTGFAKLNATSTLILLELDNTPFGDAGCLAIRGYSNLVDLSLAGTRVTDAGIQHLRELQNLNLLNVAHTAVTGDGLAHLTQVTRLMLDGTQVDDSSVTQIMALTSLSTLDLSHTAITDATLEQLRSLSWLYHLTLTGTKVTGEGFRDWEGFSELESLTLSQTALTDPTVIHLKHLTGLKHLDLSGTHISDVSLPILAQLPLESLDLCNTNVTGAGLLGKEFENYMKLQVTSDQCTEAEIDQLDGKFDLTVTVIGESPPGCD